MRGTLPRPLRYRALWMTVGWLLVALVVWGSLTPSPPEALPAGSDKLEHVGSYLVLALWFGGLYSGLARNGYALAFVAMGVGLEFLQQAGGVRHLEVQDMLANAFGAGLGWLLSQLPGAGIPARLEALAAGLRSR